MVPLGFHPAQPQPRSGGEQRRLALACALAGEARLPWLAKGSEGVVPKDAKRTFGFRFGLKKNHIDHIDKH